MEFTSFVLREATVDFSKQRVVKTEVFLLGYPNVTHVTHLYSQNVVTWVLLILNFMYTLDNF